MDLRTKTAIYWHINLARAYNLAQKYGLVKTSDGFKLHAKKAVWYMHKAIADAQVK